jgi:hypothetical protein
MKSIIVPLCLFLVACVEVKDVKNKEPQLLNPDFGIHYRIQPLAQPQTYLVSFSGINCDSNFRKVSPQKNREVGALSHCEHVVSEAGLHDYSFNERQVPVIIPEDLVIDSKISLSQLPVEELNSFSEITHRLTVKGRLYLKRGAQLITEGKGVLIEAELIESEGAEILSFERGQQAPPTRNGRNGGLIWIKAQEIKGSIKFILRGENGGEGENHFASRKKIHELNLEGGHGGNSGRVYVEVENQNHSYLQTEIHPGLKGMGSEVKSSCFMIQNCQVQTLRPKGSDGADGLPERSCRIRNRVCSEEIPRI